MRQQPSKDARLGKNPQKRKSEQSPTERSADPFETAIDKQIGDLVPQGARSQVVSRITHLLMSERFSGPIAHPRHLEEYERIAPGSADRIISMAEKQQNHQISMDNKIVDAEVADRKLGMLLGGGLFLFLVLGAFLIAIFTSSEVVPGLFLGAATIGGIGLFINGRSNGG